MRRNSSTHSAAVTKQRSGTRRLLAICCAALTLATASAARNPMHPRAIEHALEIVGEATPFAPATNGFSAIRLTLSPDGRTALWFSRNQPGGAGGYDIWMSRQTADGWTSAAPVSFNTPGRDFDPAFSPDGRYVYFCSDRPGGIGGDDIYRVAMTAAGFGEPELLGPEVNSAGNEWAPMLSADERVLLFSSDGRGGAGRFDLFSARRLADGHFETAAALPGGINTGADEFDATLLADGATIVFSRAPDLRKDTVHLFYAVSRGGCYDAGARLPESINENGKDTYGPMLDWSRPDRIIFTAHRQHGGTEAVGVYVIHYRLRPARWM